MRSSALRPVLALVSVLLATVPAFAAGARLSDGPERFVVPSLDGTPVVVENRVDGRAVAAWAYRTGGEFDIAISIRDASGIWGPPVFIGRSDRANQVDPALAVDGAGHVYLAFTSSDSGRVMLSVLPLGASALSSPMPVSAEGARSATPTMAVVGQRLVIGFRTGTRVVLVDRPLFDVVRGLGIQDGPDPVGGKGSPGNQDDDSGTPLDGGL